MVVTINTDASFSKRHQKGTFAFWIKCDKGKIAESGVLKGKTECPSTAEMKCILNAFHRVVKADWKDEVSKVIVNTDCMNAIHLFENDVAKIKKYGLTGKGFTELKHKFTTSVKHKKPFTFIPIQFRHVKAHQHTKTPKNWVNDWCDREAKKHIAKFLEETAKTK